MSPEDEACSIHDLVLDEEDEPNTSISTYEHRATATRNYAQYVGIDFAGVSCRRGYVKIMTRQEAWESGGQECVVEHEMHVRGIGYYLASMGLTDGEGYYYDDEVDTSAHPRKIPDDEINGLAPERVPDNWEIPEGLPVWSTTTKDDPRAKRVWICEE